MSDVAGTPMTTTMTVTMRRGLALAVLTMAGTGATVGASACASGGKAAPRSQSGQANLITREEMDRVQLNTVYDVVSTLRPRWLQRRGTDTLGEQGQVRVYLGNTRLSSGLEALRDMSLVGVRRIEFVDAISASSRWGLDHNQGAIVVSTTAGR